MAKNLWMIRSTQPRADSLEHLGGVLKLIVASIRQTSDRRTRILLNAVFGKAAGALTVGGLTAGVATLGVASTGTPIAALSGAAATSATLFWVGSLVGLGVAAGSVILGGVGIGSGIAVGIGARRKLVGKPRREGALQDYERDILSASGVLIDAVDKQMASGDTPSPAHMRLLAEQALLPLADQINQHWDEASLRHHGKVGCRPFKKTLAALHRHRLNLCRTELRRIAVAAIEAHPSR